MTIRLALLATLVFVVAGVATDAAAGKQPPRLAPAGPESRLPRLVAPAFEPAVPEAPTDEPEQGGTESEEFPEAPEWAVSEWVQGNPGTLADLGGQVVLIHFFQMWCPACNAVSQPLFAEWEKRYGERDDVTIVSIHTVFEGHDEQTPQRLRAWVAEKGIGHAVGVDAYADPADQIPITMQRYETGGTPHVVVVDRDGRIRFDRFGEFDRVEIETLIDGLLADGAEDSEAADAATQAGQDGGPPQLAGRYHLYLKQYTRTCGRARGGLNLTRVFVKVEQDSLAVTFPVPYLDRRELILPFDAERGEIRRRTEERIDIKGNPTTVTFDLEAWMTSPDPPRFEYKFTLEQIGDRPGSDCTITGGGWAEQKFR